MLQKKTLTIRRDDHLDDPLGAAFFNDASDDRPTMTDSIRTYLGRRITLLRVEVGSRDALVTVEARGFPVESQRMLEEAELLWSSGARRTAIATMKQAADLDPLNAGALGRLGNYLIDTRRPDEALEALTRAREIVGDNVELLRLMGRASLLLERNASAIVYFKSALSQDPGDFVSLRALARLGYPVQRRKTAEKREVSSVKGNSGGR
jgi:tetratricopeptide (TPR) repeat protein